MTQATTSSAVIQKNFEKHGGKVDFVPTDCRALGRLQQSRDIKFDNFLEKLLEILVQNDTSIGSAEAILVPMIGRIAEQPSPGSRVAATHRFREAVRMARGFVFAWAGLRPVGAP